MHLKLVYQARPDIFAKEIIKPEQLYSRVIEINERVRADGTSRNFTRSKIKVKKDLTETLFNDGYSISRDLFNALICLSQYMNKL